jgi:hypothetical protein
MQEPSRRRAATQSPPELEDGVVAQQWDVAARWFETAAVPGHGSQFADGVRHPAVDNPSLGGFLAVVNGQNPAPASGSTGRYSAAIATLVAALALAVSAYTAYVQRQQVRAQVWPILEYGTGNEPELRLWLANKGVGPALLRHVIVTVDGKPAADWEAVMRSLHGPGIDHGRYSYSQETIGDRVLSAGEGLSIFVPHFNVTQSDLRAAFNQDRFRIGVEICYCSTLGDCWTLVSPGRQPARTRETRQCPAASAATFRQ